MIESENDPKQSQMIESENDPEQNQVIESENYPKFQTKSKWSKLKTIQNKANDFKTNNQTSTDKI